MQLLSQDQRESWPTAIVHICDVLLHLIENWGKYAALLALGLGGWLKHQTGVTEAEVKKLIAEALAQQKVIAQEVQQNAEVLTEQKVLNEYHWGEDYTNIVVVAQRNQRAAAAAKERLTK